MLITDRINNVGDCKTRVDAESICRNVNVGWLSRFQPDTGLLYLLHFLRRRRALELITVHFSKLTMFPPHIVGIVKEFHRLLCSDQSFLPCTCFPWESLFCRAV